MSPRVSGRVDPLSEYLETVLGESKDEVEDRHERLLLSYAELRFQMRGGGRCAVCNAPVRLVIPVVAEQKDASAKNFACLCQRCLEGERDQARLIRMQIGDAKIELLPRERPKANPRKRRAKTA